MIALALMLAGPVLETAPECRGVTLASMVSDYAGLLRDQSTDRIAKLYRNEGVIENPGSQPVRGESAVRALLSGFKGVVLHEATLDVASIVKAPQGWEVTGRFNQRGVANGKDFAVSGHFDSVWDCDDDGWLILRMATSP